MDMPGAYPTEKVVKYAMRRIRGGADVRSAAVEAVDWEAGYTMEFAPSPSAHRELYDLIEEDLQELIDKAD